MVHSYPHTDPPVEQHQDAGLLKLLFVFSEPLDEAPAVRLATWLTLAFDGGDPGSWSMSQGQHLPVCLKTTEAGTVPPGSVQCQGTLCE